MCIRDRSIHPDAIVIAGDIYDKSVPSAEAVSLFDEFLTALAKIEPAIPVLIISGNHDSAQRLDYASRLLGSHQIYIAGQAPEEEADRLKKITLTDEFGEAQVYLLPFVRPSIVRRALGQEEIESYQDAVFAAVNHMDIDTKKRNILVAHQFVTGAGRCDSEDIVVGGVDNIDASIFEAFDYAALGHIHKPMKVGSEYYCYCGTPLACSVSEAGQKKGIVMVTMKEKGNISTEVLPLPPLRQVRVIKGEFQEVLSQACEDYVTVVLTDKEDLDVIDLKDRLRNAFPYLLEIRRERERRAEYKRQSRKIEELDPFELCCSFLGEDMDEEEREMLLDVISSVQGVK